MSLAIALAICAVIGLLSLSPKLRAGAATPALDNQSTVPDAKSAQPSSAQATAADKNAVPPKFTSRSELVLVPVIVHDRSGNHVHGLKQDDFTVEENGAAQKVSLFEEVNSATDMRLKRASIAPGIFTNTLQMTGNAPAAAPPAPHINIVVLDAINTAFADQAYARKHLLSFLEKSIGRNEMTTLLVMGRGGIKVVHDFTTDPSVLIAALGKVRGSTDMMAGENTDALITGADAQAMVAAESDDIQAFLEASSARVMQEQAILGTLDGLTAIAESYRGVPGRKALIWVTGSFPFLVEKPGDPPSARGFADEMERAFKLLSDANIAVYPVDARGLVVGLMDASTPTPRGGARAITQLNRARLDNHTATLETMSMVADMTGGHAFYNTNDLEKAFEHASDDSSSYYLLGFYRGPNDEKPGWRKLKVKVSKSGLNLRSRSGYYVTAKASEESGANADVKLALRAPMDFTGLPLAVQWEQSPKDAAANPAGKKPAIFNVQVARNALFIDKADNNHMQFEVVAVAKMPTGQVADTVAQTREANLKPETVAKIEAGGLSYRNQFHLVPGEYSVRFVIRDVLTGRIGSVLAPLKVQ